MDPFLAEIRILPTNFAPRGWAWCNGQILPISQNTALFSLPNLQGSVPVHVGAHQPGPGLSTYDLGQTGGEDSVTLLSAEMPAHTHSMQAQTIDQGDNRIPSPTLNLGNTQIYGTPSGSATLDPNALSPVGGSQPHNNLMPYLTLNFNIALQGVYPARS